MSPAKQQPTTELLDAHPLAGGVRPVLRRCPRRANYVGRFVFADTSAHGVRSPLYACSQQVGVVLPSGAQKQVKGAQGTSERRGKTRRDSRRDGSLQSTKFAGRAARKDAQRLAVGLSHELSLPRARHRHSIAGVESCHGQRFNFGRINSVGEPALSGGGRRFDPAMRSDSFTGARLNNNRPNKPEGLRFSRAALPPFTTDGVNPCATR